MRQAVSATPPRSRDRRSVPALAIAILLSLGTPTLADDSVADIAAADDPVATADAVALRHAADAMRAHGLRVPERLPPIHRVTESELRARLLAGLETDLPPDLADAVQRLYRLLGLLGPSDDLRAILLESLAGALVAAYDTRTGAIIAPVGAPLALDTLAHELTHALQDELLGLSEPGAADFLSDDALLARLAALEGEATYAGNRLVLPRRASLMGAGDAPPSGLPPLLAATLPFPYDAGLAFHAARRDAGGEGLRAHRDIPLTTADVLRPARIIEGGPREPVPVTLPAAEEVLGPRSRYVHGTVLGGLLTKTVLARVFDDPLGARFDLDVDRSWAGDRVVLATVPATEPGAPPRDVLLWVHVATSEGRAEEFASRVPRARLPGASGGALAIARRGNVTAVVVGLGGPAGEEASAALLRSRVGRTSSRRSRLRLRRQAGPQPLLRSARAASSALAAREGGCYLPPSPRAGMRNVPRPQERRLGLEGPG